MYSSRTAQFITNLIVDEEGRTCSQILQINDFWFDKEHESICLMFPIDYVNISGSELIIDDVTINEFKSNNLLKTKQTIIVDRMLKFYGLIRLGNSLAPLDRNEIITMTWLTMDDHKNKIKIMRMLRSLYLLDQEKLAVSLCNEFIRIATSYGHIKKEIIDLWQSAVSYGRYNEEYMSITA